MSKQGKKLICCVCGMFTKGNQWHNRDRGYGICQKCAKGEMKDLSPEEMKQSYGMKGVHYAL